MVARPVVTRVALGLLGLAVLGALVLASSGPGYRLQVWGLDAGFAILRWSTYGALAIGALALITAAVALVGRSWTGLAAAALALAVAAGTVAVPLGMRRAAGSVPRIHDITTDTERPPEFVALRAVRERSPNGSAYGGAPIAAQQRQAYPDIAPVRLSLPADAAFARAEAAARALGWTIAAAAPANGRIEATDTTRWWGFKDDVVIRVAPDGGGSRIDARSVSRVGLSDLGVNARRIRAFVAALARPAS